MTRVVVSVRYPLTHQSKRTLQRAIEVANEHNPDLTVLHVALYQRDRSVSRTELKTAVEQAVGRIPHARYVVRNGFIVEQAILDEIAAEDADIVVIGQSQVGRFRRLLRRLLDEPDVEAFLRSKLDCDIITVSDG